MGRTKSLQWRLARHGRIPKSVLQAAKLEIEIAGVSMPAGRALPSWKCCEQAAVRRRCGEHHFVSLVFLSGEHLRSRRCPQDRVVACGIEPDRIKLPDGIRTKICKKKPKELTEITKNNLN